MTANKHSQMHKCVTRRFEPGLPTWQQQSLLTKPLRDIRGHNEDIMQIISTDFTTLVRLKSQDLNYEQSVSIHLTVLRALSFSLKRE